MNESILIAIITALGTLISGVLGRFIVIWYQSNQEKQRLKNHVLLPPGVEVPSPRNRMLRNTISNYALLGSL
jgi:hypothetical protein